MNRIYLFAAFASVVPALAWLVFLHTFDKHEREPRRLLLVLFGWGIIAGIWASGLNVLLLDLMPSVMDRMQTSQLALTAAVATLVFLVAANEEFLKYLVAANVVRLHPAFTEPVDGVLYMSSVALGFSTAENYGYILAAYISFSGASGDGFTGTIAAFFVTAPYRAVVGSLAHVSWSGIVGYGLFRHFIERRPSSRVRLAIATAIVLHAAYNLPYFSTQLRQPMTLGVELSSVVSTVSWTLSIALYALLLSRAVDQSPHRPTSEVARH